ncbi:deoxyhypusine hydroxylase-like protein [Sarcoptes scabiei]|uniref:Deoxyhypusine hydroxylase n=1 Tax=Sarcoptes scabiei TaxID=52283 RepID=A0A131ZYA7_SARSC|nr:deoxyhypusine hydroxylase-like protein [Sarcoptes scabiei]
MTKQALTEAEFEQTGRCLCNETIPINQRFRALFTLKNIGGSKAIDLISSVLFRSESILLKHECAYCLGQMQDAYAIDALQKVLANFDEHPMVRHEAGEALGAIANDKCLQILKKYINDPSKDVAETVQLAINRIEYLRNDRIDNGNRSIYSSVDPAPPLVKTDEKIDDLKRILTDSKQSLFKRYQAMFSLRNINTDQSALALAEGLNCQDSALFRHEIAFVLGQMQRPCTIEELAKVLGRHSENEMVRHECAEALGSIATDEANSILQNYLKDEAAVVRESAIVALDVSDYNNSDRFQFIENFNESLLQK